MSGSAARVRSNSERQPAHDLAFRARRQFHEVQQELGVRALLCLLIFALNEWVHASAGVPANPMIRGATLAGTLLNAPFYLGARDARRPEWQAYIRMMSDIILLTVGLLGAGGAAAGPYVAVYTLVPIYAGIMVSSTACLVATMAATVSYLVLVGLQEIDWLTLPTAPSSWTVIAFNLLLLNVVGLLTATLADAYRHSRQRLAALYQDLERAHDESFRLNTEIQRGSRLQILGEIVAGLAHEMRNALGVAQSNLELARVKGESLPPPILRHLENAEQGCAAAVRVLNGTLETARQSPVEKVPVSLFEAAQRIVDLKSYDLHREGITISTDFPPQSPRVLAIPFQLQQVVLNLVTNAQDALREASGPRAIALVGAIEDECAVLEVRDTGPGIPGDVLPRLFQPFFTTKPSGTGLGLAISFGIVQGFGGDLTAGNRPEGGAVFRLQLPIVTYEEPVAPAVQ